MSGPSLAGDGERSSESIEESGQPAVLFDMDGVLLRGRATDSSVHERALTDALDECGLDPDEQTRTLLSGYEYDVEFARGCDRLGVDPVAFFDRRERAAARRVIDRLDAKRRTPYGDASVVADIADDYRVGLVSNNYDDVVRVVVERFDFDAFEYASGRATGVRGFYRRKPAPHLLLDALEALETDDSLYVGDRETDVVAATRAGLDTAFLRRSHNAAVDLSITPTFDVDSLTALRKRLDDW
ncbi:HAD family hydrolase [Halobaculum sp. MBLA0147]|uniref:HAD family hydrolase n=1 Tax=Halobaculum sp. MBLA0147 TaxID=3079934 RepID=UPI0035242FE3